MIDERRLLAYHEAGHVVAAMLVGHRVERAEVFDESRVEGMQARTLYSGRPKCPTAWGDLAVTLAGPMAEAIHSGRDILSVLNDGARFEQSDLNRARREAQRLHRVGLYHSPDHALLVAERRAQAMIEGHWALVAQCARELYQHGRID